MDLMIELDNKGRIWVSGADGTAPEEAWLQEPKTPPTPYARVACVCLRKNIRQARGLQPPWIRRKSPSSYGLKLLTIPKRRDGRVGGGSCSHACDSSELRPNKKRAQPRVAPTAVQVPCLRVQHTRRLTPTPPSVRPRLLDLPAEHTTCDHVIGSDGEHLVVIHDHKKELHRRKGHLPGTRVALSVPLPSVFTRNVHVSENESQLCPPALMVNVIAHWSLRSKVSRPTKAKGVGGELGVGNIPVAENTHVPRILLLVNPE